MAKEKKQVEAITSMDVDFAQWYTDIVKKAELVEYSGGIGKSGINHRLKKLQEMAVGLGMEVEKA